MHVYDEDSGKPLIDPFVFESEVTKLRFSSDASHFLTVCDGNAAWIWDRPSNTPMGAPLRDREGFDRADFNRDGSRILTVRKNLTARLWDALTGNPVGEPLVENSFRTLNAVFSPAGEAVLTVGTDGTARLWDAVTGKPVGEPLRVSRGLNGAVFSQDGTKILAFGGSAQVWDRTTGRPIGEPLEMGDSSIESAIFSPDGSKVLIMDGSSARICPVAYNTPELIPVPKQVRDWARALAGLRLSEDGELVPLPPTDRLRIIKACLSGDDAWAHLSRWLAEDPPRRTIHPDLPQSCREAAERERDAGSQQGLYSALEYEPTVPLARLLLAEFVEKDRSRTGNRVYAAGLAKRTAFLRDYDLERLPNEVDLWARASASLIAQDQVKAAVLAARKAETLDATKESAG
jgi:hypothetical protein